MKSVFKIFTLFQEIGIAEKDGDDVLGLCHPQFSLFGELFLNTKRFDCGFDMGSIVGVHLDMRAGTLGFSLNRKFLGYASKRLKDIIGDRIIFPVVRTRFCCVTKLIFSESKCQTLFNLSLKVLPENYFDLLPPILKRQIRNHEKPNYFNTSFALTSKNSKSIYDFDFPRKSKRNFSWFLYFFNQRKVEFRESLRESFINFISISGVYHRDGFYRLLKNQKIHPNSRFGIFITELMEVNEAELENENFLETVKEILSFWNEQHPLLTHQNPSKSSIDEYFGGPNPFKSFYCNSDSDF